MPEPRSWWASLRHGGLLIAPSRLAEFFPEDPKIPPDYLAERLRRDLTRFEAEIANSEHALLTTLLVHVCELGETGQSYWKRGADVGSEWTHRALTGEAVKPRWLWHGLYGARLPVFVDTDVARLGIGRGRRSHSRVVQWLRAAGLKVALLTNLRQWRIVHAGLDFDAWAEADSALFFEEGRPGPQITALQALLSPRALVPAADGEAAPLLRAIQESRRGQAELSAALGERVRRAVELLIQEHGPRLEKLLADRERGASPRDIYIAATRLVMRMVVVLFAEARDLLPRDNPLYHGSYGLQGLRETLERAGGGSARERLRNRYGAWPRALALFRLVHEGSHHQLLPIPHYGGDLFAPGAAESSDPIRRALAVLEDVSTEPVPSDLAVWQVLDLLCRTLVRVRQGRGSTSVFAPVDFSDLSSEYIGILYEGLLDYELRRATDGDPMVFLALGDEPALPLSRLEAMDDKALGSLVEKFKAKAKAATGEESDEEEEEAEEAEQDEPGEEPEEESKEEGDAAEAETAEPSDADARHAARERAEAWARRAVTAGNLVPRPRSKKAEALRAHEQGVLEAAARLVQRVVLPGEFFLVRWGGTRKGAGTFYTRPQLAVPTVQRTLRPLAFDPPAGGDPEEAPAAAWTPKRPEEILALKVCDPAMGSGSFLVGSLRFLTDALFASLHHHGRVRADGDTTLVTLAEGKPSEGRLVEEPLPCRPDADDFEPRLRARLKRYVVERCLYGVDLDPLAVELARLALWIETMDRSLPFGFLDHKVKCGNALVGCWFDRFRDYPALAWEREGGDKNHSNGVHFKKEAWTKAIRRFRNERIKTELASWIEAGSPQGRFFEGGGRGSAEALHDEAVAAFSELHSLPVHDSDGRATFYRERIERDPELGLLREAFDTWCAIWFWPPDRLGDSPTPLTFTRPGEATRQLVRELCHDLRFFHWELEFPDAFARRGSGFDALVGNPPWDIQKPNSKEFFSNLDPLYRTYEGQEARDTQRTHFERDAAVEKTWLTYRGRFNCLSNWCKNVGLPFGDPADGRSTFSLARGRASRALHDYWRARRSSRTGFADEAHPFLHQGSADINTYKMFTEMAHAIMRAGGHLGLIAPAALYSDEGATDLRKLLIDHASLRWLCGFENRKKLFPIDSRVRFCAFLSEKGAQTREVLTSFGNTDFEFWQQPDPPHQRISASRLRLFSPEARAVLEVQSDRDLKVLERIFENSRILGAEDSGWGVKYETEFHMTNQRRLFETTELVGERGVREIAPGLWLVRGCTYVPLYTGKMIHQYDFAYQGWVSGHGNRAAWEVLPPERKTWRPEFLMPMQNVRHRWSGGVRLAFRDIARSTDEITMIAATIPAWPCGNKVPYLYEESAVPLEKALALCGVLNSFAYNFVVRARLTGINLNKFIVYETPVPRLEALPKILPILVARLGMCHEVFARPWLELAECFPELRERPWTEWWAVDPAERSRTRALVEAVVASAYGLDAGEGDPQVLMSEESGELAWILSQDEARPKGFWRVDSVLPPPARLPWLALLAHAALRSGGADSLLSGGRSEQWQLPDDARSHLRLQVQASRLESSDAGESWRQCEDLAERLVKPWASAPRVDAAAGEDVGQLSMFGDPTT